MAKSKDVIPNVMESSFPKHWLNSSKSPPHLSKKVSPETLENLYTQALTGEDLETLDLPRHLAPPVVADFLGVTHRWIPLSVMSKRASPPSLYCVFYGLKNRFFFFMASRSFPKITNRHLHLGHRRRDRGLFHTARSSE